MEKGTPREELIQLQKKVVSRLKKDVRRLVGDNPPGLEEYRKNYEREVSGYREISSFTEMCDVIAMADVAYIGDYHTLKASQQTANRILENILRRGRNVLIAMELVMIKDQNALNSYLTGDMCDEEFLEHIEYDDTWGFRWENYKPLFHIAREKGLLMIGINSMPKKALGRLEIRDLSSAKVIAEASVLHPDSLILVIDGDWHIASKHLPKAVNSELDKYLARRKQVAVFQNSEAIYWKLSKLGLEHKVDVVRLRDDAFCVMNAPPMVKLQSFVNWQTDQDEISVLSGESVPEREIDYTEEVRSIIKTISSFFGIDEPGLDNFTVYSAGDLDFLDDLVKDRDFTKQEVEEIKRQIERDESYFIQKKSIIYLANLSVNHAAEEASHFINISCSGLEAEALPLEEMFYRHVIREAIGFAGSKVINPKRSCPKESDFIAFVHEVSNISSEYSQNTAKKSTNRAIDEKRVYEHVLEHLEAERNYIARAGKGKFQPGDVYDLPLDMYLGVVHCLGYILGDDIYLALMRGFIEKGRVRDMFYMKFNRPGEALKYYLDWVRRLYVIKSDWLAREGREW